MLENSKLTMVWRQVSNLNESSDALRMATGMTEIGRDEYSVMFDAGSYIFAIWSQREFLEERDEASGRPRADGGARLASGNSCSALNFRPIHSVANPSLELTFSVPQLGSATSSVAALHNSIPRRFMSDLGECCPFVDPSGNSYSLVSPSASWNTLADAGARLTEVSRSSPVSGLRLKLTVSDVDRSVAFYRDTLRLRSLGPGLGIESFDTGSSVLSIEPEPSYGFVNSLRRLGALTSDTIVFAVSHLDDTAAQLAEAGVQLPDGIESWDGGRWARFLDPDGHSLGIWEPTNAPVNTRINYLPVLRRLLV